VVLAGAAAGYGGDAGGRSPGPPCAVGVVMAAGAARGARLAFPWMALQRWWTAWSKAPQLGANYYDDGFSMAVGPSRSADLLEVGTVDAGDGLVIVHAMRVRPSTLEKVLGA